MEFYVLARIAQNFGTWTDKCYCFKAEVALAEDTLIVAETIHGPVLAKVDRMIATPTASKKNVREVIDTVDTAAWEKRKAKAELTAKIEQQIEERAKQIEKKLWMKSLAAEDPVIAELLKQLDILEEEK